MKKMFVFLGISLFAATVAFSQGYNVGDKATDFKLKNIDGKMVSLGDYKSAKGFIVVFTCNHCPYAKAYQDRLIELDKKYKSLGYPVVAINSNDPQLEPSDSYQEMIVRAKEKSYTFPYLFDESQDVYKKFGAKRTPHVYILQKQGANFVVKYIGAIDDNYQDATKVTASYVSSAVNSLLADKDPDPNFTKAIGCSIKDKTVKN